MNTAQLARAQQRMQSAERNLLAHCEPWRERAHGGRLALLVTASFSAGFALAALPLEWWSRAGGLAFRGSAQIARSSWLPALLGNVLARASARRGS